jgi:tetratricopeptide (TPR) repeat protein
VDRDTVPRGEALGLRLLLESDGFLKGFPGLNVPAPEGARLHDATENFSSVPGDGRMTWRVVNEKVIVPGTEGLLTIPPIDLHWFDVNAGRYRKASTHRAEVMVTPSDQPFAGTEESGFLRQELARLGDDLAFIHQVPSRLTRRASPWTGGGSWWLLILAPGVLLVAYRIVLGRVAAARMDPAGQRHRQALPRARTRLGGAGGEQDPAERWALVSRAIVEFVADCEDLLPASVGTVDVQDFCNRRGMEDAGKLLAAILESSDAARYGGESGSEDSAGDVADLLTRLAEAGENPTKPGPGVVAGLLVYALAGGLVLAGSPALAQDPAVTDRPGSDPVRLVAEGNQAYTTGDLEQALVLYLQARDLGVNDAVLHYNLGNAQARSGQLGHAVASYLRARRLDPGNDDIKANLAWVRRHLKDLELTEDHWPLFIAQFVAVVGALTLDQWGLAFVLVVWLVAGLVAWAWWRGDFGTRLRRAALASLGILLVVGAITFGRYHHEQVRNQAVVTAEVDVRSGPAENFPVMFKVHDGLTVEIEEWRQGWVRIGMGGDWGGWLPTDTIEAVRLDPAQGR